MEIAFRLGFLAVLLAGLLVIGFSSGQAAEHPGTKVEHPGKSTVGHPGKPITADAVKQTIKEYVDAQTKAHGGVFVAHDDQLNKDWRLEFVKIHDPVRQYEKDGKTIYFACSDFQSSDGKEVLDIDLWMVPEGGKLKVTDTKIHKVDGVERYQYEGIKIRPTAP